ncbi:unnamed protein product [Paramecium octaurelia]|uniref:Uncharacterized protein n=1 Tax=Paramecium octaurelia TaxID=43137 RepID=A0A8S1T1Q5_PAROT|nr:unnamed protein product [Paramecium octaurelia]
MVSYLASTLKFDQTIISRALKKLVSYDKFHFISCFIHLSFQSKWWTGVIINFSNYNFCF